MNDENIWNTFIEKTSDFLENLINEMNTLRTDLPNERIDNLHLGEQNTQTPILKPNNFESEIQNDRSFVSIKNKQSLILIISIQKLLYQLSNDALYKYDRYYLIKKILYFIEKLLKNDDTTFKNINLHIHLDSNAKDAIRLLTVFDNLIEKILKDLPSESYASSV